MKQKIKNFVEKLLLPFYKMKVIQRLILIYFFAFLIPLSALMVFYFFQLHQNVTEKYASLHHQLFSNIQASYAERIASVSGSFGLFNKNMEFLTFIESWNVTTAERIYSFNTRIRPLISYVIATNKRISDIQIYCLQSIKTPPYYFLKDWPEEYLPLCDLNDMSPSDIKWQLQINERGDTDIICYSPIFSSDFSRKEAYLLFHVDPAIFFDAITVAGENCQTILTTQTGCYQLLRRRLVPCTPEIMKSFAALQKCGGAYYKNFETVTLLGNLPLPELGATLHTISDFPYFSKRDLPALLIPIGLLFVLLTSIVFINIAAGTQRILVLAEYLQTADYSCLTQMDAGKYQDEIGTLYQSYNQMADNINRLIHTVYCAELRSRDAQYYALQAQINPHFLLNSLENIRMISIMNGDEDTSDMIYELGRMMNYTIQSDSLTSTVLQETEHCKNFLKLCAMRMGQNFQFKIDCPNKVYDWICPKFLLQPIAENAVSHAFIDRKGLNLVCIRIYEEAGDLQIEVSDNGVGLAPERLAEIQAVLEGALPRKYMRTKGHGLGILNVHERIQLCYGAEYGITLDSTQGKGTIFRLKLGRVSLIHPGETDIFQTAQDEENLEI